MADDKKTPEIDLDAPAPAPAPVTKDEFLRDLEAGTLKVVSQPVGPEDTFTKENVEKFLLGEITWAKLMGLTMEQAYAVAAVGYKLYEEARFHDARTVFEGLVLANPYDAYFHNILGAIYQQLDMKDEALQHYSIAVEQDGDNMHALINRGELHLAEGRLEQATADFTAAIKLDKSGNDPALARARVLVDAAKTVLGAVQKYLNNKG